MKLNTLTHRGATFCRTVLGLAPLVMVLACCVLATAGTAWASPAGNEYTEPIPGGGGEGGSGPSTGAGGDDGSQVPSGSSGAQALSSDSAASGRDDSTTPSGGDAGGKAAKSSKASSSADRSKSATADRPADENHDRSAQLAGISSGDDDLTGLGLGLPILLALSLLGALAIRFRNRRGVGS